MNALLNPQTANVMTPLTKSLPHAVLLSGEKGVGLLTIAKELAGRDLAALIKPTDTSGEIDSEAGTITVSRVRDLYQQTRAKNTSRQVIIIDDADRMSRGAQAAFLKLLEEPPEHIHFILTSHTYQSLLPTIRSRVQMVAVEPIVENQTKTLLDQHPHLGAQKRRQLEYLASGLPAELTRLLGDDDYFKARAEIMTDTRTLLTGSAYDKLLVIHKYQQNRANALRLVDSALLVTKRSVGSQPQSELFAQLDALLSIRENIGANCSVRLQLMSFVV